MALWTQIRICQVCPDDDPSAPVANGSEVRDARHYDLVAIAAATAVATGGQHHKVLEVAVTWMWQQCFYVGLISQYMGNKTRKDLASSTN